MTPPRASKRTAHSGHGAADRAAPRPADKRRRFDKAASTSVLLAVLIGLGAGAVGRLLVADRRAGPGEESTGAVQAGAPTVVLVVDATGRVLATYEGASLVPVSRSSRPAVTLARGPARAAAASTRAS
jgi:hypothetical protein